MPTSTCGTASLSMGPPCPSSLKRISLGVLLLLCLSYELQLSVVVGVLYIGRTSMLWDKVTKWAHFRIKVIFSCKGDVSSPTLEAALIGEDRLKFLILYPGCQVKLMVPCPSGF